MKFVIVTGGGISGVGKGIISSSAGFLLKFVMGAKVTMVKIDPYFNLDAGTMNPMEHGECFVLKDGTETDLDLGNYERFLEMDLDQRSSITSGQIYSQVLNNERQGTYLGKTVQAIPHITGEIIRRLEQFNEFDYVVIELGGTVGDIESEIYFEAFKRLTQIHGRDNFYYIHVAPVIKTTGGELKTKVIQHSVIEINKRGIFPDYLCLRLPDECNKLPTKLTNKIEFMAKKGLLYSPTCNSVYQVPSILFKQNIFGLLDNQVINNTDVFSRFELMGNSNLDKNFKVAIVGKYLHQEKDDSYSDKSDSYLSVVHALDHACYKIRGTRASKIWIEADQADFAEIIDRCQAVIITGGFGSRGYEGMINIAKYTRENDIPTLGLCLGFQVMVIEYLRSLGLDADTTEKSPQTKFPIIDLQYASVNDQTKGGTLHRGEYMVKSKFSDRLLSERFRHRYHINNKLLNRIESDDIVFDGYCDDLPDVPTRFYLGSKKFYFGTQAHCELNSRLSQPSMFFIQLIESAHSCVLPEPCDLLLHREG